MILDSNNFVDLPNAVQPDGNGFATFGGAHVSERLSFSRNLYQGMFNSENVVRPMTHHYDSSALVNTVV